MNIVSDGWVLTRLSWFQKLGKSKRQTYEPMMHCPTKLHERAAVFSKKIKVLAATTVPARRLFVQKQGHSGRRLVQVLRPVLVKCLTRSSLPRATTAGCRLSQSRKVYGRSIGIFLLPVLGCDARFLQSVIVESRGSKRSQRQTVGSATWTAHRRRQGAAGLIRKSKTLSP